MSVAGWAGTLLELFSGGERDAFMQVILGHGYCTFAMQPPLPGVGNDLCQVDSLPAATIRPEEGGARVGSLLLVFGTILIWLGLGEELP